MCRAADLQAKCQPALKPWALDYIAILKQGQRYLKGYVSYSLIEVSCERSHTPSRVSEIRALTIAVPTR